MLSYRLSHFGFFLFTLLTRPMGFNSAQLFIVYQVVPIKNEIQGKILFFSSSSSLFLSFEFCFMEGKLYFVTEEPNVLY